MHGRKERQAKPLTWHLAQEGWVVVSVNYHLSPKATFPDHLDDVKTTIAWVRAHADELGVDPDFIVLTGGSAGGHLVALAALDTETQVQGCVPLYGIYDFLDRHGARGRHDFERFFAKTIMKCSPAECPERWDAASPLAQVGAHAPPFFVLHGTFDSMAYVTEARTFVAELSAATGQPVVYAELPAAQHAFDTFHTVRGTHVVNGIARWLAWLHSTYLAAPGRHIWRGCAQGTSGSRLTGSCRPVEHDPLTDGRRRPEHGLDDQRLAKLVQDRRPPQDAGRGRTRRSAAPPGGAAGPWPGGWSGSGGRTAAGCPPSAPRGSGR